MGKKDKKEHLSDEEDLSSGEEVGDDQGHARVNAKKSKKGIKWSAVFMLGLFVVPAFFGACVYLYDMFYPEEAHARKYREKVVQCYSVANPKKLDEVDKILKKYKGNEHVLFSQLSAKYEHVDECQFMKRN